MSTSTLVLGLISWDCSHILPVVLVSTTHLIAIEAKKYQTWQVNQAALFLHIYPITVHTQWKSPTKHLTHVLRSSIPTYDTYIWVSLLATSWEEFSISAGRERFQQRPAEKLHSVYIRVSKSLSLLLGLLFSPSVPSDIVGTTDDRLNRRETVQKQALSSTESVPFLHSF